MSVRLKEWMERMLADEGIMDCKDCLFHIGDLYGVPVIHTGGKGRDRGESID